MDEPTPDEHGPNGNGATRRETLTGDPSLRREAVIDDEVRSIIIHRISWSGVFAGVAISMVAQLLLNMLGIGFGAGSYDTAAQASTATGFSIGVALWWAISSIIAAGLGGYAAGRLSGQADTSTTGWHGLTAWAFSTLLLFYLVSTAIGSVVGGAVSVVGNVAGPAMQTAASTAQASGGGQSNSVRALTGAIDPFSSIDQQVQVASNDPAAQRQAEISALRDLMLGDPAQQAAARERAVQALAKVQNIPPEQARGQVASYEQQYRQAVDQARQVAARTADAASRAILWSTITAFVALLLGAWAAWWAGSEAAVSPTLSDLARRIRPPMRTT